MLKNYFLRGIVVALFILVLVGLIASSNKFLNTDKHIKQPASHPTITSTSTPPPPTATPTIVTPTIPLATPTPTTPVYKYILWKSTDEIRLTVPTQTGYAIAATLRDEKFNIVTNQTGFTYKWSIDDKTLVKENPASFSGCTQGIQEPCPEDHYSFAADKVGKTVIRVEVSKNGKIVATTTFPLIIEENK